MILFFLHNLETFFGWLLAASWQASVLALIVLLIQWVLGSRLNPRWRYALWLLVLLRLVLPVLPESALSLFQFAPPPPAALAVSVTEPLFVSAPAISAPNIRPEIPEPTYPFSFYSLLALIWLAGAVTLFVLTWQVNQRFARQVANSPAITDPELLRLFAEAQAELDIRRAIRLIENGQVQSPAIMGLFQPTLLLPADVRKKFDARELRFIFLHELAHLKRGDVIVQALIALLQILHWFNPVLWFAFRRMRIDREPATDALVLSRTGEEEKERYGLMLIKLLEHFNQRHSLPTLVGILEDKDQFKRRFSLIARFTRGAYGWSLLGVLLIGILSVACLTKSKAAAKSEHEAIKSEQAGNVRVQFLAIDMAESDYQAHRGDIDEAVRKAQSLTLQHLANASVVARSGNATTFGHGVFYFHGLNKPILQIECTPTLSEGKIAIAGSVTLSSTLWSSDHKKAYLQPSATFPLAGVLNPTQARAFPPEGIVEPQAVLDSTFKEPRRLFVFVSVWPETDPIDKGSAPNADASTKTTDAKAKTLQEEYASWLDHAPPDQKETAAKAFTVADTFLSAMDSGSNVPAPRVFDGTMPTHESWLAYLDGVRTRFGEAQSRHIQSVVNASQPGGIYELSVSYETTFRKGNATDTALELVRLARTPPTDPKGEWKVTEFNIYEKDPTGQWASPVTILTPDADARAETYFNQTLQRDHMSFADSSVKSSTLAADAQMLEAIQKGDVAALKKVLEHAVDPNTFDPDRFHSSPVYWAVHFNQPEILKLLLEHMAEGNSSPANETPLQLAQKAHPDLVPILQEGIKRNRAILSTQLTTQLHSIHIDLPAFSGAPRQQVTDFLLNATSKAGYLDRRVTVATMDIAPSATFTSPAAPNISIWDALQIIADANKLRFDVDCVDIGNITLYPPADESIIHPVTDILTNLTAKPQKTDADSHAAVLNPALNQTLIDVARDGRTDKVGKGDVDKIAQLLDQGADPNAKTKDGTSALVWALNFGKDDAAQVLIQHGADAGAEDAEGKNAAWTAASIYFCPGALELMIKKGVDVKGLNKKGDTIFSAMTLAPFPAPGKMNFLNDRVWTDVEFQAYQERERRTVDLLLAAGVDINGRSGAESETPLMLAVRHGHGEMARELMAHGADPSLKDSNGETAAALAKMYGHPELLPLLEAKPTSATPGN